jgi:hypothetical protein
MKRREALAAARRRWIPLEHESGSLLAVSNYECVVADLFLLPLQLLASRTAEAAPKMSAKKKKRLDAYIDRKLKKEGRKDLIASLACVLLPSFPTTPLSHLSPSQRDPDPQPSVRLLLWTRFEAVRVAG